MHNTKGTGELFFFPDQNNEVKSFVLLSGVNKISEIFVAASVASIEANSEKCVSFS